MCTVQGHYHTSFKIDYWSNPNELLWGMQVGCLINMKSLAFEFWINHRFVENPDFHCQSPGTILFDPNYKYDKHVLLKLILNSFNDSAIHSHEKKNYCANKPNETEHILSKKTYMVLLMGVELILASSSEVRKELLEKSNISFSVENLCTTFSLF